MSHDQNLPHSNLPPQAFYEEAIGDRTPGGAPAGSSKVGFTLRQGKTIEHGFAFLINPQGLTRTDGSRASLFATPGHFYVDDFGPAPVTIQMRQLVARGKRQSNGAFYTAAEDVQRFLKSIFLPATAGPGATEYSVYFHDHHFEHGFQQRVFFPPNALVVTRSIEQPGIYAIDLTMIGLEKYPYAEVEATKDTSDVKTRTYTVRRGDTIARIVARLAGSKAGKTERARIRKVLLELNPQLARNRTIVVSLSGFNVYEEVRAKAMRPYPGEQLRLPR